MTLAILAKLRGTIVAVADGRLSRADGVSFDTAPKIVKVRPTYVYPRSSMGSVEQVGEHHMFEWCLLYAGTYALASEIREGFRLGITRMRVDRTSDERVDFVEAFSGAHKGNPDFYIHYSELPKIPSRLIVEELKGACQKKGDEWTKNRSLLPDAEFLLFGTNEETSEYEAYRFFYDPAYTRLGHPVTVRAERVKDMCVAAIGDQAAASSAMNDSKLLDAIEKSIPPASDDTLGDWLAGVDPSKTSDVLRRMASIVDEAVDPSIGGRKLMAVGDASHNINICDL